MGSIAVKAQTWYRGGWRGFAVAQKLRSAPRINPACPLKPEAPEVWFGGSRKATETTRVHLRGQEQIAVVSHGDIGSSVIASLVVLLKGVENLLFRSSVCSVFP